MKETEKRKPIIYYGWIVVLTGLLANIGSHGFGRMAYSIILPEMAEGLGLTWTMAGLLGTANFTGYILFALAGGYLASRYGSRKIISLSLLLNGISLMLTGMASTFPFALLMRFLTGVGNGGVYVPAMALGSLWFASRRRGLATGVVGVALEWEFFFPELSSRPSPQWKLERSVVYPGAWRCSLALSAFSSCGIIRRNLQLTRQPKPAQRGWRSVYQHRRSGTWAVYILCAGSPTSSI